MIKNECNAPCLLSMNTFVVNCETTQQMSENINKRIVLKKQWHLLTAQSM
jgi:hypothetical protein